MNIFKYLGERIKARFRKIDNFRESLEDKLADCLERLDTCESVDEIEAELIAKAIEYACSYYGVKNVPAGVNDEIAEVVVDLLGKFNRGLQNQLRK